MKSTPLWKLYIWDTITKWIITECHMKPIGNFSGTGLTASRVYESNIRYRVQQECLYIWEKETGCSFWHRFPIATVVLNFLWLRFRFRCLNLFEFHAFFWLWCVNFSDLFRIQIVFQMSSTYKSFYLRPLNYSVGNETVVEKYAFYWIKYNNESQSY